MYLEGSNFGKIDTKSIGPAQYVARRFFESESSQSISVNIINVSVLIIKSPVAICNGASKILE